MASHRVTVTDAQLDSYYEAILRLVQKGGAVIRDAINKEKVIDEKSSATDLVTETDQAVEKLLCRGLKSQFPDHAFIGEESTAAAGENADFPYVPTWIIDPVDGTMNFVHGNQNVCISVALAVNRRVEIGVVYIPVLDQLYTARRGKGAFKDGEPIQVSSCTDVANAMVLHELGCRKEPEVQEFKVQNYITFLENCHSVRQYGSAAINLCMVASGQADVYTQSGMHSWDVAAGGLIVQEAGGIMLDPSGKEFDFMSRRVLAACTKELATELIGLGLEQIPFERDHPDVCPL